VRLGDANPEAYDCAMEMLKITMDKLTPIAAVRDGMGLEDRTQPLRIKGKETVPAIAYTGGNISDAEGSAIGDFIGLNGEQTNNDPWARLNTSGGPPIRKIYKPVTGRSRTSGTEQCSNDTLQNTVNPLLTHGVSCPSRIRINSAHPPPAIRRASRISS
jgi:hypothetical protein